VTQPQPGLDALLDGGRSKLGQPMHRRRGEVCVHELDERVAVPPGQRRIEFPHRPRLVAPQRRHPGGVHQVLELDRVDGHVAEGQPVTRRVELQVRGRTERPSQPRDVRAEP
jgi:hypothetical protein